MNRKRSLLTPPLSIAVMKHDIKMVNLLLNYGAEVCCFYGFMQIFLLFYCFIARLKQ